MKKDDFIEKTKEMLTRNSKQMVLEQINRFYNASNIKCLKTTYKIGDKVFLKKGTLLHGTYKNLEGLKESELVTASHILAPTEAPSGRFLFYLNLRRRRITRYAMEVITVRMMPYWSRDSNEVFQIFIRKMEIRSNTNIQ